jgi:hypothetical protein
VKEGSRKRDIESEEIESERGRVGLGSRRRVIKSEEIDCER